MHAVLEVPNLTIRLTILLAISCLSFLVSPNRLPLRLEGLLTGMMEVLHAEDCFLYGLWCTNPPPTWSLTQ